MNLPPYNNFPVLKDVRITLRSLQPADIRHLVEISFYDSVVASSYKQAMEMNDKINRDYETGNSIHWGIAESSTNRIAGTCGYYRGFDKQSGELGFVLLPQYRGKGYMAAALALAVDFGFTCIGLERIWAVTDRQNLNAVKLLEGLHFKKVAERGDEVEFELIKK
jgi:[ribosomal protein S5]-alanine N-acetyltransferase